MYASRFILPFLLATTALTAPSVSRAQVSIGIGLSITIAPPALPIYVQPVIPAEGYLWTPGYWGYADAGYYWVPGTWVQPPSVGVLWTPGYWGWNNGAYAFNAGYWGPHVGFYGGINYGFGYGGSGYEGGRWNNGAFAYNNSVNNFGSTHIANTYNQTIVNNNHTTVNNVSYNGGTGGVAARPTAQEESFAHEQHVAPTPQQVAHVQAAQAEPSLRESANHGHPAIAATAQPAQLHGAGTVQAKGSEPAGAEHPAAATAVVRPGQPPLAQGATSHTPGSAVSKTEPARPEAEAVAKPAAAEGKPATSVRPPLAQHATAAPRPTQAAARPAPQAHAAAPRPQAHAAARPAAAPAHHAAPVVHPAAATAHPEPQRKPAEKS